MIDIVIYKTDMGGEPFTEWFNSIKSTRAKSAVMGALNKLECGLVTNCVPVGKGVHEYKIHVETGYRLYFGNDGDKLIVLLTGSQKSDQRRQIRKAHEYWANYKKASSQKPRKERHTNDKERRSKKR